MFEGNFANDFQSIFKNTLSNRILRGASTGTLQFNLKKPLTQALGVASKNASKRGFG